MPKPGHPAHSRETGQAIILIAFSFIGLLAFVGIVVDLGRYLVAQAQLRRAVDAAALAGAAQFRVQGFSDEAAVYDKVNRAARSVLSISGIPTETLDCPTCTIVDTRYTRPADPLFDTNPPTKKVRVRINDVVQLIFLRLVGWGSVGVSAESITEAAAVDVALVLDVSDSMSSSACAIGDYPCDYDCSQSNTCEPLQTVKSSALAFLDYLSPGYDRVTVVPFALQAGWCINPGDSPSTWNCPSAYDPGSNPNGKYLALPTDAAKFASNLGDARAFISGLKLAIPWWAYNGPPPENTPTYPIPACPGYEDAPPPGPSPTDWDPRQCTNTNFGGGIRAAAQELLKEFDPAFPGGNPDHPSKERLRVIVLLTDGVVNASGLGAEGPTYGTLTQQGWCPQYTWTPPGSLNPFCRAMNYPALIEASRHISTSIDFDSVDYTLDYADFAMLEAPIGNSIVVFTIGLGNEVINAQRGDPLTGAKLLRYIAAGGDDADALTDLCMDNGNRSTGTPLPYDQSCGNYYYAPDAGELVDIFTAIAGRIFTRISQ
jgi:Flp pilus assembly protein TadG